MRFINPKTDFAFKKIFGSDRSKPILMSFLNALLYQERPVIVDLEILDPYLAPKILGLKNTFVDVRARLQNGRTVIIEMQVLSTGGFEKRVLYNAAKAYSTQLPEGEDYELLNAVVALTITDFVMFPETRAMESAFVMKEKQRQAEYPEGDIELVFVELPKFKKRLDELTGVKDKWLYFLRHAPDLELIPETLGEVPEISTAFQIANTAGLSAAESDEQQQRLEYINYQHAVRRKALVEGEKNMAMKIARQLLSEKTDDQIAALTGLSPTEVAAMRMESPQPEELEE